MHKVNFFLPSLPLQRFSNCSKTSVSKTLRFKAPACFRMRNSKLCGNSRVEEGEDCDPGLLHLYDDPCCTPNCKFKQDAMCRCDLLSCVHTHTHTGVKVAQNAVVLRTAHQINWQINRFIHINDFAMLLINRMYRSKRGRVVFVHQMKMYLHLHRYAAIFQPVTS